MHLETFLVTHFMEEVSYVFLFAFFLLPLIFILVATNISHILNRHFRDLSQQVLSGVVAI